MGDESHQKDPRGFPHVVAQLAGDAPPRNFCEQKRKLVFMQSALYFGPIFTITRMCSQILAKLPNIKWLKKGSAARRVDGQTR